jgi:hypothetical protein
VPKVYLKWYNSSYLKQYKGILYTFSFSIFFLQDKQQFKHVFSYDMVHYTLIDWTGYEGNSTVIVPKVPTIFRGNAEENSWYKGDN